MADVPEVGQMVKASVNGRTYFGRVRDVRMLPTVVLVADDQFWLLPLDGLTFELVGNDV